MFTQLPTPPEVNLNVWPVLLEIQDALRVQPGIVVAKDDFQIRERQQCVKRVHIWGTRHVQSYDVCGQPQEVGIGELTSHGAKIHAFCVRRQAELPHLVDGARDSGDE